MTKQSSLEVYKFGGVAVGTPAAVRIAVEHVRRGAPGLVAVVSAMNGVTDLILDAARAATRQDYARTHAAAAEFEERHVTLIANLFRSRERIHALRQLISDNAREMRSMTDSIGVLRELTRRAQDALVARGERVLAQIFTELLIESGVEATYVDGTEIIVTETRLGWPNLARCERAAKRIITPILEQKRVVIVPGYIGSGADGEVVTLGRGGSDFSAAIIARSIGARSVTLFKEVDGLMTADPKSVPSARLLPELHYREAAELAFYGARVLHPRTMIPLLDRRITLRVRNTFREESEGTRIADDVKPGEYPVRALTAIHRQALISIEGNGMMGVPGVAARAVAELDASRALVALHNEFQLDKVRPLADSTGGESKLTLLGFGQIGRELTRQLVAQEKHLRAELGLDIKVIAIADRSGIKIEEKGFKPASLQRLAKQKASGTRLFDRSSPVTLKQLQSMMREELWLLPSHRPILVDLTSEETAPLIQEALERGFHIVLANKKPLAVPQIEFDRMMQTAKERGLAVRYEATAGAGLPVLDTLAKLHDAGDRVETILGCFSGTLGFLMTALEDGTPFSEAVRQAWKLGYTEPDPRDDLSGTDVARKALILARTLGRRIDLSEVAVEPLYTQEVDDPEPAKFIQNLERLDQAMSRRVAAARATGKSLRYVAKIGRSAIRVGIEEVPEASPMGRLRGTDNQVVIYSKRYKSNPLIVTGPGAGAGVTAAGVLNDIVAITMMERRPRR